MPSRIIHYCIGNELMKLLDIDFNEFMIGNLSPDAHGGASENIVISHFKSSYKEGIDKYPVIDLNGFMNKHVFKMNEEFFQGYLCHLITDNMWSREIYVNYLENHEDEKSERVKRCYYDYGVLNKILIKRYNLNKFQFNTSVINFYPEGTSKEFFDKVVEGVYKDFESNRGEELSLLNIEFVDSFIKNVTEECIKELIIVADKRRFSKGLAVRGELRV